MAGTTAAGSEPAPLQAHTPALVLASASASRRALLAAAGLRFDAVATGIDEAAVKQACIAAGVSAGEAALRLARLKAGAVRRPEAMIVGCDQILVCDDVWFDKAADLACARAQLRALRGRTHELLTAVTVLRDGAELWHHLATPRLAMRPFSDAFLDAYLEAEGDRVLGSVGAYRLEGPGIHLFDAVEGEHTAILGLPMLPLLGFLRSVGLISA